MKKGFSNFVLIITVFILIIGVGAGIFYYQKLAKKTGESPGSLSAIPESQQEQREEGIVPLESQPEQSSGQTPAQTPAATSLFNWSMLGHDSAHTGFSESKAPNDNTIFLNLSFDAGNPEMDVRGLVFENNRLYFGAGEFVYAVDALKGNLIWKTNLGGLFSFGLSQDEEIKGLAVVDGKSFVSKQDTLYALDAENGGKLWNYKAGDTITAPTVTENRIYFGSNDNYLYALEFDGELAWRLQTNGNIHSVPAATNDKVCFGTEDDDWSVYCLNAITGQPLWRRQFATGRAAGGMFHAPATISGNLVLIGEEGGSRGVRMSGRITPAAPSNFYALDINNGDLVWSYQASDWIIPAAAAGYGKVYFSSWDGYIYAVDIENGNLVWKSKGGWAPAVADGKVFVGSPYDPAYASENNIFAYNAENGNIIWNFITEDLPVHLLIGEGKLYAGFTSPEAVDSQIIIFGK